MQKPASPAAAALVLLTAALLAAALPAAARAQAKNAREFTKQGVLIPDLTVAPGVDPKTARRAGDDARDAVESLVNKKEVDLIDGGQIGAEMVRSGFQSDGRWREADVRALGVAVRADEYLWGRIERAPRREGMGDSARLAGTLVLMRGDGKLRQPLPPAVAPRLEDAARALGRSYGQARAQLVHQRRCENALRTGRGRDAVAAARAGIAAYSRATLARTCLLWALKATAAPYAEVLAVARELLDVDTASVHALEAAAVALDSMRRHAESREYWVRLARTDTADLELGDRVLFALADGGSTEAAEALAAESAARWPDYLPFRRHLWRNAYENRHWPVAIAAAEILVAQDAEAAADSTFARRLALAYRGANRPFDALATLAKGVARFRGDARLYALYAQSVKEEADTVLPRGLATFEKNGELLALVARDLRARGKLAESADAMRLAVAHDSTLPDGPLVLAQAELDLGRPDSALAALRRAVAQGHDSTRVAQYAAARGNALFRAASGTRRAGDYALSLRFVAFADSVRPSAQSRFLLGLAALGAAQSTFAEAATTKDRAQGCTLARSASELLPLARDSLERAREVAADAAQQGIDHLAQLEPYGASAVRTLCGT